MEYDYSNLIGKIITVCGSRRAFAEAMQISERTLCLKLTNRIEWRQGEMVKACQVLGVPVTEIIAYFFTFKVQNK